MTTPSSLPADPAIGFIVGTGRCGSSLVHEVLARHPSVGFVSNIADRMPATQVLARHNNAIYRHVSERRTRKGRLRFAPSEGYRLLDSAVSPAISRPGRDLLAEDLTPWLRDRLRGFFLAQTHRQNKPLFTHKLTGWPRTGLLQAAFPAARVLHVVRDGRAVANSFLQMPWWGGYAGPDHWRYGPLPAPYQELWEVAGRSFIVLAGLTWRLLMDAYEAAERAAPAGQWLTVRYEDLVEAPRVELARILQFFELDWSPAFERGLQHHTLTGGRSAAFREDLSLAELAQLTAVLGDAMQRYGYARLDTDNGVDNESEAEIYVTDPPAAMLRNPA